MFVLEYRLDSLYFSCVVVYYLCERRLEARLVGTAVNGVNVVLATVKGDIHDIGKNIVKLLLENYGFKVIDLGKDVPCNEIVESVIKHKAPLLGLSALMTTTLPSMEETVKLLKSENADCKIMVGGAVLTPEYAEKIGADFYAKDAKASADISKRVFEK